MESTKTPVQCCRFYLLYISLGGSLPMIKIPRSGIVAFQWLSFKVAYTIGIVLFNTIYGYSRIKGRFSRSADSIQTDEMVIISIAVTTPVAALVITLGMIYRGPKIYSFLRMLNRKLVSPTQPWARKFLIASMTLYLATVLQIRGPRALGKQTQFTVFTKVGDAIFWLTSIPAITSPSVLYTYVTILWSGSYSHLKRQSEKWLAMAKNELGSPSKRSVKRLAKLQQKYQILCNAVEQSNSTFSPMVLLCTMYYAIEMSMFLYGFVIVTLLPGLAVITSKTVLLVAYTTLFFYHLVVVNEAAQRLQDESDKCLLTLAQCIQYTSTTTHYPDMLAFLTIHLHRPPTNHASSYFHFNRAALVTILSAMLTFIIILVQFKSSEEQTIK